MTLQNGRGEKKTYRRIRTLLIVFWVKISNRFKHRHSDRKMIILFYFISHVPMMILGPSHSASQTLQKRDKQTKAFTHAHKHPEHRYKHRAYTYVPK